MTRLLVTLLLICIASTSHAFQPAQEAPESAEHVAQRIVNQEKIIAVSTSNPVVFARWLNFQHYVFMQSLARQNAYWQALDSAASKSHTRKNAPESRNPFGQLTAADDAQDIVILRVAPQPTER